MKSLSLGTVLEKNFCSDLSNYLSIFLDEIRYTEKRMAVLEKSLVAKVELIGDASWNRNEEKELN